MMEVFIFLLLAILCAAAFRVDSLKRSINRVCAGVFPNQAAYCYLHFGKPFDELLPRIEEYLVLSRVIFYGATRKLDKIHNFAYDLSRCPADTVDDDVEKLIIEARDFLAKDGGVVMDFYDEVFYRNLGYSAKYFPISLKPQREILVEKALLRLPSVSSRVKEVLKNRSGGKGNDREHGSEQLNRVIRHTGMIIPLPGSFNAQGGRA